jgi:HSP20 family protein
MTLIRYNNPAWTPRRQPVARPDQPSWTPAVDIAGSDSEYVLRLDVPGVDSSDVEVKLEDHVLAVTGERKAAVNEAQERFSLRERRLGAFSRSFRLPEAVDADNITARYDKGVLEIRVPKVDRSRKITVQ